MRISRPTRVLLLSGILFLSLVPVASAQCGMFSMGFSCTPATPGMGMTCMGSLLIDCYLAMNTMSSLTMGVPCSMGAPAPGLGVMIFNNQAPMVFPFMPPPAGGAMCTGTPGTGVGTRMATAVGMGSAAGCRVGWSIMCAVTGIRAGMATMSDCMAGGNQAIARACDFVAPGLPVELMEFSVEDEASGD